MGTRQRSEKADVVIVGGGHNGLVAAAYLARAGLDVLVLERSDSVGGAARSDVVFPGVEAWLSRYSYLVSLLPDRIIEDLGLDITLLPRRYASYTPDPADPGRGLLVDGHDAAATAASFAGVGAEEDAAPFARLGDRTGALARSIWPTMTEPLLRRSEARALVGDDELWRDVIERPIGELLEREFSSDLVRGIVLTDALIGTFAGADQADLAQNRCFLYHVIGRGTGEWSVPVGGMGAVSAALERAARSAGARIVTGAEVVAIDPQTGVVRFRRGRVERRVAAGRILANVAPAVLDELLDADTGTTAAPGTTAEPGTTAAPGTATAPGTTAAPTTTRPRPEGAQVKVNLVVSRLPRLLDGAVAPEAAFGGTMHVNEGYDALAAAHRDAGRGRMTDPIPCEVYCHTLTDPSILSPELAASGAHTLTVFGLHTPHRWLTPENNERTRDRLTRAVLASLDSVLAEPIESLVLRDENGEPCIETRTTQDLEDDLAMPGGDIFHGPLSWPFVEDDAPLDTAAERWGVATAHRRVLLCGAGARRGGGVSGIGGHNAAMAVIEEL